MSLDGGNLEISQSLVIILSPIKSSTNHVSQKSQPARFWHNFEILYYTYDKTGGQKQFFANFTPGKPKKQ